MGYTFYAEAGMEFAYPPVQNDLYRGERPHTPRALVGITIGFIEAETPLTVASLTQTVEPVRHYTARSVELGDPWAFVHAGTTKVVLGMKNPTPLDRGSAKFWEQERAYLEALLDVRTFTQEMVDAERERTGRTDTGDLKHTFDRDGIFFVDHKDNLRDADFSYVDVFDIRAYLPGTSRGNDAKTQIYLPVQTRHVEMVTFVLRNPLLTAEAMVEPAVLHSAGQGVQ